MTKAEIVAKIVEQTGIEKSDVLTTVECFISIIKSEMESGEDIFIRGFGSFVNKKRAKKVARNISKNTAMVIDEHYVPSFKPAKEFADKVRENTKFKLKATS